MDAKTIVDQLPGGLLINGTKHTDFELRQADVGDMIDAEEDADVSKPVTYNTALLCRQLVRVGTFDGPFTMALLRRLTPAGFMRLRDAQKELDALGEDDSASGGGGS